MQPRRLAPLPWLMLALLAGVLLGPRLLGPALQVARAAPSAGDIRYLSVTGDGPTARAWFEGGPAAGTSVQEALDRFAKEGFRVVELDYGLTVAAGRETPLPNVWTILLERRP